MKLATERQKQRMASLKIVFDEETTLEEAAALIRAENRIETKKVNASVLSESNIVMNSEWED